MGLRHLSFDELHLIDPGGRARLREQMDRLIVDGMTAEAITALEEDSDGPA